MVLHNYSKVVSWSSERENGTWQQVNYTISLIFAMQDVLVKSFNLIKFSNKLFKTLLIKTFYVHLKIYIKCLTIKVPTYLTLLRAVLSVEVFFWPGLKFVACSRPDIWTKILHKSRIHVAQHLSPPHSCFNTQTLSTPEPITKHNFTFTDHAYSTSWIANCLIQFNTIKFRGKQRFLGDLKYLYRFFLSTQYPWPFVFLTVLDPLINC